MTPAELIDDEVMLDRRSRREQPHWWSDSSPHGMVASAHYRATAAGLRMLEAGGNAIDAAVATAFALGVCEPAGSGLGGMAMVMVHLAQAGRTFAIEGPCRAPLAATPEAVGARSRKHGYPAVAVPTNVATLGYALDRHGTKTANEVLEPAIRLATDGVRLTPLQAHLIGEYQTGLVRGNAAVLFLTADHAPLPAGHRMRQPVLARTLGRLAQAGLDDFYTGEIGRRIAADMDANGGFVCARDLVEIPLPSERDPVRGTFGDWTVCSLAPPGGGNALLEMLHLIDELGVPQLDPDSPEAAVLLATLIQRVRRDRRRYRLGGPDVPDLGSREYARSIAPQIRVELDGPGETSHLSVMDRWGNAVALTQSIERSFGAQVMTPDLGFLYNGYMQGFKVQARNHPHYLRPGAVARSNAGPTIVLDGDRPLAVLGSTGSERMTSGIAQTVLRLRTASPFAAVSAPRLHCTPEAEVLLEAGRFSTDVLVALEAGNFTLRRLEPWSFTMGGLQLVTHDGSECHGVGEPRRDGAAAGPRATT